MSPYTVGIISTTMTSTAATAAGNNGSSSTTNRRPFWLGHGTRGIDDRRGDRTTATTTERSFRLTTSNCCDQATEATVMATRCLFCIPYRRPTNDDNDDHNDSSNLSIITKRRTQQQMQFLTIRWTNFVFALWGVFKFALDAVVVVRLFEVSYSGQAVCLLVGMISSFGVHFLGERRISEDQGKVDFAPFFMDPTKYYESFSQTKQDRLLLLFAITFKEVSAFLFEDGAFIAIYGNDGVRDGVLDAGSDVFQTIDMINVWMTLVRSILAVTILGAAFVATWNISWCRKHLMEQEEEVDNSWSAWFQKHILWGDQNTEQMTRRQLAMLVIKNTIKVFVFLLLWAFAFTLLGTNIGMIMCFTNQDRICDLTKSDGGNWTLLAINWMLALYYAYLLIPTRTIDITKKRSMKATSDVKSRRTRTILPFAATATTTAATSSDDSLDNSSLSLTMPIPAALQNFALCSSSSGDGDGDVFDDSSKSDLSRSSSSLTKFYDSAKLKAKRVDFVGAVLPAMRTKSKSERSNTRNNEQDPSLQWCDVTMTANGPAAVSLCGLTEVFNPS